MKIEKLIPDSITDKSEDHFSSNPKTPLRSDAFDKTDYEKIKIIEKKVLTILETLGMDMTDDSLKGTPLRVAKMFVKETFGGLHPDHKPKASILVPTGLSIAFSEKYEIQIRPRSGLAAKYNISVLNTPGTIDSDYRGEIKVIIYNHGNVDFIINNGDRIAQMVLSPVIKMELEEVNDLPGTMRGEGGFGSTGK